VSSKKLLWSCKCGHTITISSTFYLFFFTGAVDPALVLEQIESHIATVKEEAFSRKDILEKVERWLNACEEEAWLEDYNKVRMIVSCDLVLFSRWLQFSDLFLLRMTTVIMLGEGPI